MCVTTPENFHQYLPNHFERSGTYPHGRYLGVTVDYPYRKYPCFPAGNHPTPSTYYGYRVDNQNYSYWHSTQCFNLVSCRAINPHIVLGAAVGDYPDGNIRYVEINRYSGSYTTVHASVYNKECNPHMAVAGASHFTCYDDCVQLDNNVADTDFGTAFVVTGATVPQLKYELTGNRQPAGSGSRLPVAADYLGRQFIDPNPTSGNC